MSSTRRGPSSSASVTPAGTSAIVSPAGLFVTPGVRRIRTSVRVRTSTPGAKVGAATFAGGGEKFFAPTSDPDVAALRSGVGGATPSNNVTPPCVYCATHPSRVPDTRTDHHGMPVAMTKTGSSTVSTVLRGS